MVGPARKREALTHVEEVLEVSERRVCEVIRATPACPFRLLGGSRSEAAHLHGP